MDTITEKINIKNHGDSIAQLKYEVISSRILDTKYSTQGENSTTSIALEESLSHDYPFHINISLSNYVIENNVGSATFEVSASWPLDAGNNALDSEWGTKAYEFNKLEQTKFENDSGYSIESPIQIVLKLTAEQYVESNQSSSRDYAFGNTLLYDVVEDDFCSKVSSTCLSTTVIDENNKLGDGTITVIPNILNDFQESTYANYTTTLNSIAENWNIEYRGLTASDILKIISKDINSSNIIRNNLSNVIIGKMNSETILNQTLNSTSSSNGHFEFLNNKFEFLYNSDGTCYWTMSEYNSTKAYAFSKVNDDNSKLYGENKTTLCQVIPVIVITKNNVANNENG